MESKIEISLSRGLMYKNDSYMNKIDDNTGEI